MTHTSTPDRPQSHTQSIGPYLDTHAGLRPVDRCAAQIAAVPGARLVPGAWFFQQTSIRAAVTAAGDTRWLPLHEGVIIFASQGSSASSAELTYSQRESVLGQPQALERHSTSSRSGTGDPRHDRRLDVFAPPRVDRRPQPAPPANAGGGATAPRAHLGRDAERTADPCLPYPRPRSGSVRTDAADHRPTADHNPPPPQPGPSYVAGRR
jgi:hypothetical protein